MQNIIKNELLALSFNRVDDLLMELIELRANFDEWMMVEFWYSDFDSIEFEYDHRRADLRAKEREIEALGYFGHREWSLVG